MRAEAKDTRCAECEKLLNPPIADIVDKDAEIQRLRDENARLEEKIKSLESDERAKSEYREYMSAVGKDTVAGG